MKDENFNIEEPGMLITPTKDILFGVLKDGTVVNNVSDHHKENEIEGYVFLFRSIAKWIRYKANTEELVYYGIGKMLTSGEFRSALQSRTPQMDE